MVYASQIYMCSVQKLNKLISHYFYIHSLDFVLYFSFFILHVCTVHQ